MDKFLSGEIPDHPFVMFSSIHFITLGALTAGNLLLLILLMKHRDKKVVENFRYYLAGFLLLNELFFIAWTIWADVWSVEYALPLHLCDAAVFLSIVMLVRNSYYIFEVVYFWGLAGGMQALITPDLLYPFPHFRYLNFFISHGTLLTVIIYMIVVKHCKPTPYSLLKTFIFTNLYMAIMAIVNIVTGGNYMFICRKPEGASIIDFLGPWPWYVLSLEAVGIMSFILCYAPFGIGKLVQKQHADITLAQRCRNSIKG